MVVSSGKKYSIDEIKSMALDLKKVLLKNNVSKNSRVAFRTKYDYSTLVCFLAVWELQATCVPLDYKHTKSKISEIIEDSNIDTVLARTEDLDFFDGFCTKINIDDLDKNYNLVNIKEYGDFSSYSKIPAYIVFTSGTTNKPKGVMVNWDNVKNYTNAIISKFDFVQNEVGMITTSLAFDLAYTVLFTAIFNNYGLVLPTENEIQNPSSLLDLVYQNSVTYIKTTPSVLKMILKVDHDIIKEKLKSLKFIFIGGEPINYFDVQQLYTICKDIKIINHYGPCETTIGCCMIDMQSVNNSEDVSIGQPFGDNKVDIVDENLNQVQDGESGRLLIYGPGVSDGYINFDNKNFINYKGQKAFLTEDIGVIDKNNNIKLVGRTNDFVKIKGYRVSIERIKKYVEQLPFVKKCSIFAYDINSITNLFCFYEGESVGYNEFFEMLSLDLAEYEIPRQLIHLEKIPVNSNGKSVNKNVLIENFYFSQEQIIAKQKTEIAKKIYKCWYDVGGAVNITTKDYIYNFIDSLSTIMFISGLEKCFNIKIELEEFFERCENINDIVKFIKSLI